MRMVRYNLKAFFFSCQRQSFSERNLQVAMLHAKEIMIEMRAMYENGTL